MPAATRRLLAILAVASLAIAGCSADGGSEADDDTTTTTSAEDDTSTTEDDTSTTSDDDDDPAEGPTSAELEAILPTAEDVGDGWTEDTDDGDSDDDSTSDDAFDEQCPEVAALDIDDDEDDEVERSFTNVDESTLDVSFSSGARPLDEDDVTSYVEAINACGEVTLEEDGMTTTVVFEAAVDDSYGDVGLRIQGDITVSGDTLPQDVTFTIYSLLWREGPVGVEVGIQDGLDPETYEAIPADTDVALAVADLVAPQIADLVG